MLSSGMTQAFLIKKKKIEMKIVWNMTNTFVVY